MLQILPERLQTNLFRRLDGREQVSKAIESPDLSPTKITREKEPFEIVKSCLRARVREDEIRLYSAHMGKGWSSHQLPIAENRTTIEYSFYTVMAVISTYFEEGVQFLFNSLVRLWLHGGIVR